MTGHIVFGTGQVGRLVSRQLVDIGHDVVAVNRSGRGDIPGARVVAGDATDLAFTSRVAAHADVVYFCLNATNYSRWATGARRNCFRQSAFRTHGAGDG